MAYRCQGQLKSRDGPLSVWARPSRLKRDCSRAATRTACRSIAIYIGVLGRFDRHGVSADNDGDSRAIEV
jgi:hypothetical protein